MHNGPVAQLGARFHGMEEVVGSIPTRSTIFSSTYGYPRFQFGVIWCQNALTSSKLRSGQPLVHHGWFALAHGSISFLNSELMESTVACAHFGTSCIYTPSWLQRESAGARLARPSPYLIFWASVAIVRSRRSGKGVKSEVLSCRDLVATC